MIKVPVLDDKSYSRLLTEAMAMIPTLTDKWTDFNPQDTGMMLLELLAGMTEMQNFYLDQVGDRFYQRMRACLFAGGDGQGAEEPLSGFDAEQLKLRRAVTNEDYRRILLEQHKSDFHLDDARVRCDGKTVYISVLRQGDPLSPGELKKVSECLEDYRLLTTRIRVDQLEAWSENENKQARSPILRTAARALPEG